MIVRLALLAALAVVLRRLLARRSRPAERAAIGYADGSTVVLEPGAPGLAGLVATAREALAP